MDLKKLMQQAQSMQQNMQHELDQIDVSVSVGGGMVRVTMAGNKRLKKIEIEPDILDPEDPGMVQDLVLSAVNEASRKVDDELKSKIGNLAPGLGLPGLP